MPRERISGSTVPEASSSSGRTTCQAVSRRGVSSARPCTVRVSVQRSSATSVSAGGPIVCSPPHLPATSRSTDQSVRSRAARTP